MRGRIWSSPPTSARTSSILLYAPFSKCQGLTQSVLGWIVNFDRIPNMFGFWKWTEYWIPNIFGFWKLTEYEYRIVVFGPNYSNSSNSERIIQSANNTQMHAIIVTPPLDDKVASQTSQVTLSLFWGLLWKYFQTLDAFPILVLLFIIDLCKVIVISQHFLY